MGTIAVKELELFLLLLFLYEHVTIDVHIYVASTSKAISFGCRERVIKRRTALRVESRVFYIAIYVQRNNASVHTEAYCLRIYLSLAAALTIPSMPRWLMPLSKSLHSLDSQTLSPSPYCSAYVADFNVLLRVRTNPSSTIVSTSLTRAESTAS